MSSGDFSVKALAREDWKDSSIIRLEALQNSRHLFLSRYEDESKRTPQDWQDLLGKDDRCFFGLYDGVKIVGLIGVITWYERAATGAVVAHYITPDYRKRGLSEPMYRACLDWAKKHEPWKKLIVTHRANNIPSQRAIQHAGFVFAWKESMTWPDGQTDDEIIYEIDLEQMRKQ
jgi:RimJ/RimL family protein N-acetyltransferase